MAPNQIHTNQDPMYNNQLMSYDQRNQKDRNGLLKTQHYNNLRQPEVVQARKGFTQH